MTNATRTQTLFATLLAIATLAACGHAPSQPASAGQPDGDPLSALTFGLWDTNNDGALALDEVAAGYHDAWDTTGDDAISRDEFHRGALGWCGVEGAYGAFSDWDADGDGAISAGEWRAEFMNEGIHSDTDGDGVLRDEELRVVCELPPASPSATTSKPTLRSLYWLDAM